MNGPGFIIAAVAIDDGFFIWEHGMAALSVFMHGPAPQRPLSRGAW